MRSKTDLKKKVRKGASEAGNFLRNPALRKLLRFGSSMLDLYGAIRSKDPFLATVGVISAVDAGLDAFEVPFESKLNYFVKKHGLLLRRSVLPKMLIDASLDVELGAAPAFKDNGWIIKEIEIDGNSLYYALNADAAENDPVGAVYDYIYYSPDFNFESVFRVLWDHYEGGVHLSVTPSPHRGHAHDLRLFPLKTNAGAYIGELEPESFAKRTKCFIDRGISRSFMLAGKPGVGKSSFALEASKHLSNRIIKIDPAAVDMLQGSELDFLLEGLCPDVLIFDDFDRAAINSDASQLLFMLEKIKTNFPQTVVFSTVNYFERLDKALVRPGRFDKIIWFDDFDDSYRQEIAEQYLRQNNVELTAEQIKEVVSKTEGLSPAYIKELCTRVSMDGFESLDSIIYEFRRSSLGEDEPPTESESRQTGVPDDWFVDDLSELEHLSHEELDILLRGDEEL